METFMMHFALTGALIANDFRDGRKCGFKEPAIFPLSLFSVVDRESREQRTWNIFGDRERERGRNRKRRPLAMSRRRPRPRVRRRRPKSISAAARDETAKPALRTIRAWVSEWFG